MNHIKIDASTTNPDQSIRSNETKIGNLASRKITNIDEEVKQHIIAYASEQGFTNLNDFKENWSKLRNVGRLSSLEKAASIAIGIMTTGYTAAWLASMCMSPYPIIVGSAISGIIGLKGLKDGSDYRSSRFDLFKYVCSKLNVENNKYVFQFLLVGELFLVKNLFYIFSKNKKIELE